MNLPDMFDIEDNTALWIVDFYDSSAEAIWFTGDAENMKQHEKGIDIGKIKWQVLSISDMVALLLQILRWSLISLFCPKIGAVQSTSKKSGGGIAALLINHGQSS